MTATEFKQKIIYTSAMGGFPAMEMCGGACRYLTKDGLKCVVGLLIPDGHRAQYRQSAAYTLFSEYPDLWKYIPTGMTIPDMVIIQKIHDGIAHDMFRKNGTSWPHQEFVQKIEDFFMKYES